ncbi:right-handed parallel beta-helix repeat-containing protein [Longispora sp. NPDC051575]|uniref:right-handed parallel beta-helix repeat-containing protein n=1 Tax=Longispora sp. NPDC051575 TaxID=3154943 RepID=UPI0034121B96
MRKHHLLGLAMATLATATGLTATATPAAAAPEVVHVDNTGYFACSDDNDGSTQFPVCTIAAGMARAAGSRELVIEGTFDERLTVTRSGTPGAPFRIWGAGRLIGPRAGVTVDGQHDVEIRHLRTEAHSGPSVTVSNSTRIALNTISVASQDGPGVQFTSVSDSTLGDVRVEGLSSPGISLDAATSGVTVTAARVFTNSPGNDVGIQVLGSGNTITRSQVIGARKAAVLLGAGATGNVVSASSFTSMLRDTVTIDNAGATGTAITNNSLSGTCLTLVRVSGNSSGVSVQNNAVSVRAGGGCDLSRSVGIGVYDAAVSGTTVDYNTVTAASGARPYAWTTPVLTLAAFRAASGQGAHDSDSTSPSVNLDSANSAAPGFPARDYWNHGQQDNPGAPNTGVGPISYGDRGSYEDVRGPNPQLTLSTPDGGTTVRADAGGSTPGWAAIASYTFRFDDGHEFTQAGPTYSHMFWGRRSNLWVNVVVTDVSGTTSETSVTIQPGDGYSPLGPVRVLDTRERIGVGTTTPIAPGGVASLRVTGGNGVPTTGVTAVTMNVTVTAPTSSGFLTVEGQGGWARDATSNLNWVAGQTVPNLVVVEVVNGVVDFRNRSDGTVHVVADLVGYHSIETASRFRPTGPVRVLDTRETPGRTPVAPGGTVLLPVAGVGTVPAGVTAVTLNVTATEPTNHGFLTVYPDGRPRPNASSLNWTPGLTVPNLVVVPVVNGKVAFHNTSPGTVHVVADLVGYHTAGVGAAFHTASATRVLDTRAAVGSSGTKPIAPNSFIDLSVDWLVPSAGPISGVVLNVTVTEPTGYGFLTVYPATAPVRPNASNLNWRPGQTVPNLVIVPSGTNTVRLFNSSPGTVHVVADLYGYYTG